jgi:hypothetical protein
MQRPLERTYGMLAWAIGVISCGILLDTPVTKSDFSYCRDFMLRKHHTKMTLPRSNWVSSCTDDRINQQVRLVHGLSTKHEKMSAVSNTISMVMEIARTNPGSFCLVILRSFGIGDYQLHVTQGPCRCAIWQVTTLVA